MLKRLFESKYDDRIEYFNIWQQLHRTDGPAREWLNGSKEWYYKGQRHRIDGPAIELFDGTKEWYLEGKKLSEQEFNSHSKMTKFRDRKEWKNPVGQLHRTDGPAIEQSNGSKSWWLNGKLHRENEPAIEHSDGTKEWWLNGKLHRENGPAIEHSEGTKEWYLNGQKHRENGPAVEYSNGSKYWYLNGHIHRTDGPAYERWDGVKIWYFNGENLTKQRFMEKIASQITEYYDNISIIYCWHSQCPPSAPLLHEIDIPFPIFPIFPTAPPLEE